MRTQLTLIGFFVVASAASGCTSTCNDGTALITIAFDGPAANADLLDVLVSIDDGSPVQSSVSRTSTAPSGTLEVVFPKGYMSGHVLKVSVTAERMAIPIASTTASFPLQPGCTTYSLTLSTSDSDMGTGNLPIVNIAATPDLVGFTTKLDGSSSTDPLGANLTYAWSFTQVPSGSTITDASLASKTAARTSFEPDLGGDYLVTLDVAVPDGRRASKTATVTVPTVPVFHSRLKVYADKVGYVPALVRSDGTGLRSLSCSFDFDGGLSDGADPHLLTNAVRAYEPPSLPGQPKFAFIAITSSDFSTPPELHVANELSDCASPGPRVDNNAFNDHVASFIRFSPDGSRIAYYDEPIQSGTSRLVTVAADGTGSPHVIRSNAPLWASPFWVDNATVGWVENNQTEDVFQSPDENGAGEPASSSRQVLLHCDSSLPDHLYSINQIAVTPFGLIVAGTPGVRSGSGGTWAAMNLYRLMPGNCTTTDSSNQVLDGEGYGGEAWDFDLSPDRLIAVYSTSHGEGRPDGGSGPGPQHDIYIVPTDGSSLPHRVAGDPTLNDWAPRWVAAGRQIVWIQSAMQQDAAAAQVGGSLFIANADGSHVRNLRTNPDGAPLLVLDTGTSLGPEGCQGVPGRPTGMAALLALAVLTLTWALRKVWGHSPYR